MKKLLLLSVLLIFACSSDSSSNGDNNNNPSNCDVVYLDDNGVTIKACDDANVGDTGLVNGATYTVVDEAMLRDMVANEEDVTRVVTTFVTNTQGIFGGATPFNQDISNWDMSNVTNMIGMFNGANGATTFNQDISNWDVSSVTNMSFMFFENFSFNQPLDNWDVSNVTDMTYMFYGATSFNQPIGDWDVSNVIVMEAMFADAQAFNQDISNWNVDNVKYCAVFSSGAPLTEENAPNFTNCTP